jgi:hypothetical protein
MSTRAKFLLTVVLAVLWWLAFGCSTAPTVERERYAVPPVIFGDDTTLDYLQRLYPVYNEVYFDNKLPKDTVIDLSEAHDMATTVCDPSGTGCSIRFNLKYVAAPRTAQTTMLHEMCHIKTRSAEFAAVGSYNQHSKIWRSCMLTLDMQGAIRDILIDNYQAGM